MFYYSSLKQIWFEFRCLIWWLPKVTIFPVIYNRLTGFIKTDRIINYLHILQSIFFYWNENDKILILKTSSPNFSFKIIQFLAFGSSFWSLILKIGKTVSKLWKIIRPIISSWFVDEINMSVINSGLLCYCYWMLSNLKFKFEKTINFNILIIVTLSRYCVFNLS